MKLPRTLRIWLVWLAIMSVVFLLSRRPVEWLLTPTVARDDFLNGLSIAYRPVLWLFYLDDKFGLKPISELPIGEEKTSSAAAVGLGLSLASAALLVLLSVLYIVDCQEASAKSRGVPK